MTGGHRSLVESITLSQAKAMIKAMAHEHSLLLLSPPGVGKSDIVVQAAAEANLPVRSLLGTQIAPEDVSGIPKIVGNRSIFCPPRILLPEDPQPFCLFLDELPACSPDVQKAFYSLLLERRLGEHYLPAGTWVIAAGNRLEDRALIRAMSSALVNRVFLLQVRVDHDEWLAWARQNHIRQEIIAFIQKCPKALMRPAPDIPQPFSTPRAWASLSQAINLVETAGICRPEILRALTHGRISRNDAVCFCQFLDDPASEIPIISIELWQKLITPVSELDLSMRSRNCLKKANIIYIKDLVSHQPEDFLQMKNMGQTSLYELQESLEEIGLNFGMKLDPVALDHAERLYGRPVNED